MLPLIILMVLALASMVDIHTKTFPHRYGIALLLLAMWSWVEVGFPSGGLTVAKAIGLTLLLTLPGYIRGVFGAGDIKCLLPLALINNSQQMLLLLILSFVFFCLYWGLFYRKSTQAPFIPAVFFAMCVQISMVPI